MKQQDFMYSGLGERLKKEWKIYLAALIFIIIADSIGQIKIPLGPGTLILFPIFYSIFLGILSGPQILKTFKKPEVKAASKLVIVCICPFIAKLGINAGASIETVISAGPALLLQEFGNLGTIFLSLPIALLLGLKREAVGACHSINRETNLALMQDVFGPDSDWNYLLWIHGNCDCLHRYLPSIFSWYGFRCWCRYHDGNSYCYLIGNVPCNGRSDQCTCKCQ